MARLKHCRGGTRAALAGLWAGLVAVSVLCACALAGAWLSAQWRVWLLCAAAVCAIACPCLGAAIRRIASGRRGEKQACAVLKGLPAGYTVLCNVPMQANGRKTELDAAVAGPGGVCVVEVKHYAGDVFGTEHAAAWRQARPGKGGRRIEKSVPNPVAQNRRQVAIVRAALQSAGGGMPGVGGRLFFKPLCACACARARACAGRRRPAPCRVRPGAPFAQPAARGRAGPAGCGQPAPLSAPQPGQSTKGISACFFCGAARRACPLPPS